MVIRNINISLILDAMASPTWQCKSVNVSPENFNSTNKSELI